MVALLNQVGEVVNAARKAVPVQVLCGMMVVVVVMEMMGAGGVMAQARAGARARGKAHKQANGLALARAGVLTLSVVTCTLEIERGVHDFGSRCIPGELGRREGVSYSQGQATVATLQAGKQSLVSQ